MNIILKLKVFHLKNIFRFSIYSDILLNIYYYLHLYHISYVYYHYHTRNIAFKTCKCF